MNRKRVITDKIAFRIPKCRKNLVSCEILPRVLHQQAQQLLLRRRQIQRSEIILMLIFAAAAQICLNALKQFA